MNTARAEVPAKLNLTLDITGREGAFHTIDSLVCSVDLGDRVVAKKRKDGLVRVTMRGMGSESLAPEETNANKAPRHFVDAFKTAGADITVYRNIPAGAGLGSSSADAAGVLKALAKLYEIEDEAALKALADGLGSDTGYMLAGGFARLTGRGEKIERLNVSQTLHFLLIAPRSGVSSGACYQKFDELGTKGSSRTGEAAEAVCRGNFGQLVLSLGNDLYPAAKALNGDVEQAMREALSFSPSAACMTGSGSAVFALFPERELCEWAKSRYRGKFRTYVLRGVPAQENKITLRSPYSL